jgi:glutathione S-transferase
MRARMALHLAGTEYEHREVLLRDKPADMLEFSPKGSVPVFVNDGKVIDESIDIMRWALPDADIDSTIIEMIDGPFKYHLDRYKYASRYDDTVKRGDVDLDHRDKAVLALAIIEGHLKDSPFLAGDTLGPTDMASFPFIRQFAAVEPDWWAAEARVSRTRSWLAQCLESTIFKAVMEKHPLWESPE